MRHREPLVKESISFSSLVPVAESQVSALRSHMLVVGIDLGTTNSAIAKILVSVNNTDALKPRCLDIEQPHAARARV